MAACQDNVLMNETNSIRQLQEMQAQDIASVCHLIAEAMSVEEAKRARQTFDFHFKCNTHGLDDGRRYFIHTQDGRVAAVTGLHHYDWGPRENVWLAWFAVHPDLQRQGLGRDLLKAMEGHIVGQGQLMGKYKRR